MEGWRGYLNEAAWGSVIFMAIATAKAVISKIIKWIVRRVGTAVASRVGFLIKYVLLAHTFWGAYKGAKFFSKYVSGPGRIAGDEAEKSFDSLICATVSI